MTEDDSLTAAVSKMVLRSEREGNTSKLVYSFVDAGILEQINNANNQIIYGRRGTGKTHILKYYNSILCKDKHNIITYIDARNLGSTSAFTDSNQTLQFRCLHLFQDILELISDELLEHIANSGDIDGQFDLLQKFEEIITLSTTTLDPVSYTHKAMEGAQFSVGAESTPKLLISSSESSTNSDEISGKFSAPTSITFPEVNKVLERLLHIDSNKLYILIDEWSSIPFDLQPYLAEFLKRSFMTEQNIIIKIATLEYRSNFNLRSPRDIVGFEFGGEISIALEIDDYYVFDRNPEVISNIFLLILYKHLQAELYPDYLKNTFGVNDNRLLISKLFTSRDVFNELVRASEGVIRDFINIFKDAYFDAKNKKSSKIDKLSIIASAQKWYERDKLSNLDPQMNKVLMRIIENVIGDKKARSFMLQKSYEINDMLLKLFDARVIHIMKQGYSDKDHPGIRYNIYTLDYGTYVALMNTKKSPQITFEVASETTEDIIIPFDDRRSIRRIILDESTLIP